MSATYGPYPAVARVMLGFISLLGLESWLLLGSPALSEMSNVSSEKRYECFSAMISLGNEVHIVLARLNARPEIPAERILYAEVVHRRGRRGPVELVRLRYRLAAVDSAQDTAHDILGRGAGKSAGSLEGKCQANVLANTSLA